jgi:hypothetical protein
MIDRLARVIEGGSVIPGSNPAGVFVSLNEFLFFLAIKEYG